MWVVYRKELQRFFNTAMGYIVIAVFLLITGLFLWVFRGEYNVLDSGYANLDGLFVLAPWLFFFLAPAVTMQLFAEEQDKGTVELLYTKPVRRISIVLGKFFAGFTLMLIALLPTLLWYATVWLLAEPMGNVDSGAFWGSFLGLVFLAATYVAIGVFASALSKNQLVAFVVAVIFCFCFLYGFELVAMLFSSGSVADVMERFGIDAHYRSMSRGVLDSRDILYFLTLQCMFLLFTHEKIKR